MKNIKENHKFLKNKIEDCIKLRKEFNSKDIFYKNKKFELEEKIIKSQEDINSMARRVELAR